MANYRVRMVLECPVDHALVAHTDADVSIGLNGDHDERFPCHVGDWLKYPLFDQVVQLLFYLGL